MSICYNLELSLKPIFLKQFIYLFAALIFAAFCIRLHSVHCDFKYEVLSLNTITHLPNQNSRGVVA